MSTAGNYADFDEYIEYQIRKTRSGIKWTELLTSGLAVAVFVLCYLLVFTLLDHWVVPGGFSVRARAIMLGIMVVTASGWVAWKLVRPWFRNITGLYAAHAIEESDPDIKSAVLNFIDARNSGRDVPPHILRAMEKRAAIRLSRTDVERAVDRSTLMRLAYALLGLVVVCCLYTVLSPKDISFARALSIADQSVATTTEFLEVSPGDIEVLAGEFVEVTVDLRGDIPESVTAYCTTQDRGLVDEPVELRPVEDETARFAGRINGANGRGILQPMSYRIVAGDAESRDYQISVIAAPSAVMDRVDFVYPEYMEFAPNTLLGGDFETWEGAEVTFHARTNMSVSTAVLQFTDHPDSKGEEVRMEITDGGRTLTGQWVARPRTDGSFPKHYRIYVRTEAGQEDPDPLLYNIKVQPDQDPEVELLDPLNDLEMPANGVVPLLVKARDKDFKLRSVALKLRKDDEDLPPEELIFDGLNKGYRKSITESYDLHLRPKRLQPGDVVTFYIEARDNKPPLGNRATTPPLTIRIVAPVAEDKVQEQLERQKKAQQEQLEQQRQEESGESGESSQSGAGGDQTQPGNEQGESSENQTDQTGDASAGSENDPDGSGSGENREGEPGETSGSDPSGGDGAERSDKADDDEALQRFIDEMKKRQEQQSDNQNADPTEGENNGSGDQSTGSETNSSGDTGSRQSQDPSGESNGNQKSAAQNPDGSGDPQSGEPQKSTADENKAASPDSDAGNRATDKEPGDAKSSDPKSGDADQPRQDPNTGNQSERSGLDKNGETTDESAKTGDAAPDDQGTGDQRPGDSNKGSDSGGNDASSDPGEKQKGSDQTGSDANEKSASDDPNKGSDAGTEPGEQQDPGNGQKGGEQKGGDQQGGEQKGAGQKSGDGGKGKQGSQSGSSGKGKSAGKGGQQSDGPGGYARGGDGSEEPGQPGAEGGGEGKTKPTDPNLEDARKAANLVLKQIEDDMQRGEVNEKILRELGWSKEDLERFSDRMRKQLNSMEKNPDEPVQKTREFEEMLRSLNLKPRRNDRQGSGDRDRITDGVNVRRSAPPADLREVFEAYQRSLSRKRNK